VSDSSRETGEQRVYGIATPSAPVELLPGINTLNLTLFRPVIGYLRIPKFAGKTYSRSIGVRILTPDDSTGVAVILQYNSERWPVPYGVGGTIDAYASDPPPNPLPVTCYVDKENNALYFSLFPYNAATLDMLPGILAGEFKVDVELAVAFTPDTIVPLAADQTLSITQSASIKLTNYTDALASKQVVTMIPSSRATYTFGSPSDTDHTTLCYDEGSPQRFIGQASRFACSIYFPDPVVGVPAMNFSYTTTPPVVLSSSSSVNHNASINGAISGHHVIGASVPLPAAIKMVPTSMTASSSFLMNQLNSVPCEDREIASFNGNPPALRTVRTAAICPDTGFSFRSDGSMTVDLEVVGSASLVEATINATNNVLDIFVPAGNVTVLKLSLPFGAYEVATSPSISISFFFEGDCATGLKPLSGPLSKSAYIILPGADTTDTMYHIAFYVTGFGCFSAWTNPSVCASRIPSTTLDLGFANFDSVLNAVEGADYVFKLLFPGQDASTCYNAFMNMSCDTSVPFCVNGVVRTPQVQSSEQCEAKLMGAGCSTAQLKQLCTIYPSVPGLISLNTMLYGPPASLPPVGPPMNPPASAPINLTSPVASSPVPISSVPSRAVSPTPGVVSPSSKSAHVSVALFIVGFISFVFVL
jgi:hypothetical protein